MMSSQPSIVERLAGTPLFWVVLIAALFSWPIVRAVRAEAQLPGPRPVLGTIGEFHLKDQYGQPFGTEQLRGKVWIAQFFRASSPDKVTFEQMSELQHRTRNLGEAFHLVTFTVDPEHDSRKVLAKAAKKHRASRRAWSFLTGRRAELERALGGDMGIDLEEITRATFSRLALIDQRLRIRGFYDLTMIDSVDPLLRDAGLLVNRGD